jgi:hypothetical protein
MKPDSRLVVILLLAMPIGAPRLAQADPKVIKVGDGLIDAEALTIQGGFGQCINGLSFQQDAIVTHGEHQYVAYYDANRRVCLARRELPQDRWRIIRFADYDFKSNDAHNTISMGVCPKDGTIHLAFDHHGHPLHYRVSRKSACFQSWCSSRPKEHINRPRFGFWISRSSKGDMHRDVEMTAKQAQLKQVSIFTDGGCDPNPGPGGYE